MILAEDLEAVPAGSSPADWEQWTPRGCRRIAERYMGRTGCDHYAVQFARKVAARAVLLQPVADAHGVQGLLLVRRLPQGSPWLI